MSIYRFTIALAIFYFCSLSSTAVAEPNPPLLLEPGATVSTGDAQYLMLTPERMAKIKANIASGKWQHWKNFKVKVESRVNAGPSSRKAMLQPIALYIATGEASNAMKNWWPGAYVDTIGEFLNDSTGNNARQSLADFAYAFKWIEHYEPNIWTGSLRQDAIEGLRRAVVDNLDEWEKRVGGNTIYSDDSDYTIAAANLFQAHAELGVYDAATQTRIEKAREQARTLPGALPKYMDPTFGVFAGGKPFESNSYAANTPRFFQEWALVAKDRGVPLFDANYAINAARVAALMAMPNHQDTSKYIGFMSFNDALADPDPNNYIFGGKKNFRVINYMYGMMIGLSPDTAEHRYLKWMIEQQLGDDRDGFSTTYEGEHGTPRILTDDVNISPLPIASAGLPTFHLAGGSNPLFLSRRDWQAGAPQMFAMTWTKGMVHHWAGAPNHYELFNKGVSIARYQNNTDMSSVKAAHNIVYIENNGNGGEGFNVVGRPGEGGSAIISKKDPINYSPELLGKPTANSVYSTYAADAKNLWNRDGRVTKAFYVKQNARRIFNVWDQNTKVAFVLDRIVTDPGETADGITGIRRVQRVTRMERKPVLSNGWYTTGEYDGQISYFKELLANPTTTIVDESSYGSTGPSYRKWHLSDVISGQLKVNLVGVHVYGDASSVQLPSMSSIPTGNSQIAAYNVATSSPFIVVVNLDPSIPIDFDFQLDGAAALDPSRVFLLDVDENTEYDLVEVSSGYQFTASATDGPANESRVQTIVRN